MARLSHISSDGSPNMVDVAGKAITRRRAVVEATLRLKPEHVAAIQENPKGNVLSVAQIAGIQGGKRCSDLIPLCHQVPLSHLDVTIVLSGNDLQITAVAEAEAVTGVEMEAYLAASIAGVTLIDMLKAAGPDLTLSGIRLVEKSGGKTHYKRGEAI